MRVTYEEVSGGQVRKFGDSVSHYRLRFEAFLYGGENAERSWKLVDHPKMTEAKVIALIEWFRESPLPSRDAPFPGPRLTSFAKIDVGIWEWKITSDYTD